MLLLVALAATGCDDPAVVTFPPAVTYDLPADVLPMVLPATGPETRWRQGLDTFQQAISRRETAACLAPRGVAPPDGPPPMFVRFRDIPDLPYLEAHGFAAPTPPPGPPSAVPSAAVIGPPADPGAAQSACRAAGAARIEPLRALTDRLTSAWLSGLSSIDTDPGVRAAYRVLPACLHDHRVEADGEEAFFDLLDATAQADPARGAELAVAYATCMTPVEVAREPLRARLRDEIAAAHPVEVTRLRASLPSRLHDLERATGVRLCFPAV